MSLSFQRAKARTQYGSLWKDILCDHVAPLHERHVSCLVCVCLWKHIWVYVCESICLCVDALHVFEYFFVFGIGCVVLNMFFSAKSVYFQKYKSY